ncbi:hypothetical protein F5888DRAFT_1893246 [Russula emetica]|nr:hypothetical protein F5888DRAFT_1893246 [Russula emetica]
MVSRPQASGGLLNGLLYVLAEVTQVGWRPNRAQMSGEGDKGDSIEKTARIRQPNYVHVLRHKPTKASNANKRPGQVVINSGSRRPKEVVQAERTSRAEEKEKKVVAEEEGIQEVARIENDARKKKNLGPNGQRNKVTRGRKPRAATPVSQGYSDGHDDHTVNVEPQPEPTKRKPSGSGERSTMMEATNPGPCDSGESSGDNPTEWQPQGGLAAESMSSDLEEDIELGGEEPDTMINMKKKSSKEQERGPAMRDCINKAAAGLNDSVSPNSDVQKRKAGPDIGPGPRPTPKKARKSKASTGLVAGWKKTVDVPLASSKPAGTRHASESRVTTGVSRPPPSTVSTSTTRSRRTASAPFTTHNEPEASVGPSDNPEYAFGGLPLDEEVAPEDTDSIDKYQSLTKVNTIHTSPVRTKVSRQADASTGRYRFKNSDLPPGTADRFAKEVLPLAFDTAGALGPWECLDDEHIITIWNLAFSSPDDHPIASGDVKGVVFLAVKGLVKRGISMWLHKFSMAAEKALVAEFERQHITTTEERANFVRYLLGDVDDISSKRRLFLWKSAYDRCEDSDSPDLNRLQGLFQGRLVAQTFLEHILATTGIDKESRVNERPIGALITSIQAVHHALLYSMEGTFKPPQSKSGAFSKANWGDYDVLSPRGAAITVKRASVFLKKIQGLKDQQWDDIYKTAREIHAKRVNSTEDDDEGGESDTSDDDELLDPLYDEVPT